MQSANSQVLVVVLCEVGNETPRQMETIYLTQLRSNSLLRRAIQEFDWIRVDSFAIERKQGVRGLKCLTKKTRMRELHLPKPRMKFPSSSCLRVVLFVVTFWERSSSGRFFNVYDTCRSSGKACAMTQRSTSSFFARS